MAYRGKSKDDRSFTNELQDYSDGRSETVFLDGGKARLTPSFQNKLVKAIKSLCLELDGRISNAFIYGENIYTGTGGIALLALLNKDRNEIESRALNHASRSILAITDNCRVNDRISFLNGNVGIIALAALIHHKDGNSKNAKLCVQKLLMFSKFCFASGNEAPPDELLYGRSGYLYALLLIRRNIPYHEIQDSFIKEVAEKIITSGKKTTGHSQSNNRLWYEWHEKEYIGAAHGYCGIIHTLLLAYRENLVSNSDMSLYIKPTMDYVLNLQYPSRNLPSSVSSHGKDSLVQWCHGAPGAIHMVALAYEIFKEKKYLKIAIDFGEVTWERGLLKKGYSLCHGVSGNGYSFLRLFQMTGEIIHLHRATKFAEWCFKYGKRQKCEPDRPCSLYEGLSGVIYFLMDLQEPEKAKFPGVEI